MPPRFYALMRFRSVFTVVSEHHRNFHEIAMNSHDLHFQPHGSYHLIKLKRDKFRSLSSRQNAIFCRLKKQYTTNDAL